MASSESKASEEKGADNEFDANAASKKMDLYSRQIAAVGLDTMKNLSQLRVLIIGLRGVGVETSKNLILAGPKHVSLYDDGKVEIADLGCNFYFRENDIGKKRSEACVPRLKGLNPFVDVRPLSGNLSDELIQSFGAIVITDTLSKKELLRINKLSRTRQVNGNNVPAAFILAVTHGVSAHFFTDFGDQHAITDPDGEPAKSLVIEKFEAGIITVAGKRHGLDDGTYVTLEDIEGAAAQNDNEVSLNDLNGLDKVKVKRRYYEMVSKNPASGKEEKRTIQVFNQLELDLEETEYKGKSLGEHLSGGIVNEIKPRIDVQFRSLEETLDIPATDGMEAFWGPQHPDQGAWSVKGAGKMLHLMFHTALLFHEKHGRFMKIRDDADSKEFKTIFVALNEANRKEEKLSIDNEQIDELRLDNYSWFFNCELTGYCAFLGGVAAQEIMKKFGKYTPVQQWLHSDHIQLVGQTKVQDGDPLKSRYDHQIAIFGKQFQDLLGAQQIFLVGTGALGCEYLKGLAMMGVCCGEDGQLICTDMDRIEVSNLSRQFLFRANHVGKPKSITASNSVKEMNPSFNVKAIEMRVGPETENDFNDKFWGNLDLCWNALDNVQARKYTDKQCLLYGVPLLESGTQGTKCNSEVIIPYQTKSYNDGKEQESEGIPMCTLQNFPYLPVHCIEWSRASFSDNFESNPQHFNSFVESKAKFFDQVEQAQGVEKLDMLRLVKKYADLQLNAQNGKVTFQDCIRIAFDEWVIQHYVRIRNLIYSYPDDRPKQGEEEKKDEDGNPVKRFWTGRKKFPQVPEFSLDNEQHLEYLWAAGNLHAFTFGLQYIRDKKAFKEAAQAANLVVPQWVPKKIEANDDEDADDEKKGGDDNGPSDSEEEEIEELTKYLNGIDTSKLSPLNAHDFEKDDDTNFHIDYITICANTRAWNYRIKQQSRHQCKIIAGKIIAALATTTAMITGLVELEFTKLKLAAPDGDYSEILLDRFYNANINLAVSQFQYFEPDEAIKHEKKEEKDVFTNEMVTTYAYPDGWTSWDKLVVNKPDITITQFVEEFPKLFGGTVVVALGKHGASSAKGEGKWLYNRDQKPKKTKMQEQLLKRPNLSEAMRKRLQGEVDAAVEFNKTLEEGRNAKVIDHYLSLYEKPVDVNRRYVLLDGMFEDKDGNPVIVPIIKYIFKARNKK